MTYLYARSLCSRAHSAKRVRDDRVSCIQITYLQALTQPSPLRGQGYLGIRSWKMSLSTYLIEGLMVVI